MHLFVKQDAGLRGLVMRLVQNNEVCLWRETLKKGYGANVFPIKLHVGLHDLLQKMTSWSNPVDLEGPP